MTWSTACAYPPAAPPAPPPLGAGAPVVDTSSVNTGYAARSVSASCGIRSEGGLPVAELVVPELPFPELLVAEPSRAQAAFRMAAVAGAGELYEVRSCTAQEFTVTTWRCTVWPSCWSRLTTNSPEDGLFHV